MLRFYTLFIVLFRAYGDLLYANLGDNVTLPCVYSSSVKHLTWYKQVAGEQPQMVSSFYKHSPDSNSFQEPFKDEKRFSVQTGEGFYNLIISNVQDSDSAMYYCGHTSITVTEFYKATFLVLKESGCRSYLQQPDSESVQPGGSVTLNCTVLGGTRDREHSIYWFKRDSTASRFGTMYIPIHSSSVCVRSSGHSCVYSLSKRNVSLSDAGIYHCAVASCGEIVFGTGTALDVGEKKCDTVMVHCVVAALVVSFTLNLILFCFLCKKSRRHYLHSEGADDDYLPDSHHQREYTADSQNEVIGVVQYVALDFKQRKEKSSRQRNTKEETVYAGVRLSHLK
ncbi:uncharacterized protein [Leuresthes tenuis]|uniref:uncharacterized protein n=1 Tax=Leuresthes tenuis TaxID=355514 RepID=UPI003B50C165